MVEEVEQMEEVVEEVEVDGGENEDEQEDINNILTK